MTFNIPENSHYVNRYFKFINSIPRNRNIKYTEKHHIIPKCLGGDNEEKNIIRLTYREHFIAHLILTKCFYNRNRTKMVYAFNVMLSVNKTLHKREILKNSRYYDIKRKQWFQTCSGKNSPLFGKSFSKETKEKMKASWSEERKQKMRELLSDPTRRSKMGRKRKEKLPKIYKERKKPENFTMAGKSHSEETKIKMSNSAKGKIKSEEHRKNISNSRKGYKMTEEVRNKISQTMLHSTFSKVIAS